MSLQVLLSRQLNSGSTVECDSPELVQRGMAIKQLANQHKWDVPVHVIPSGFSMNP